MIVLVLALAACHPSYTPPPSHSNNDTAHHNPDSGDSGDGEVSCGALGDPAADFDPTGVWDAATTEAFLRELQAYGPRWTGSPAHHAALDAIEARFIALGAEVERESWSFDRVAVQGADAAAEARITALTAGADPGPLWNATDSERVRLELIDDTGAVLEEVPVAEIINFSGGTGSEGVEGPLVDIIGSTNRGALHVQFVDAAGLPFSALEPRQLDVLDPDDLLDSSYRTYSPINASVEIYLRGPGLVGEGALGHIAAYEDVPGELLQHSMIPHIDATVDAIPGVLVGREGAAQLRAALDAGAARARLVVQTAVTETASHTLIATVPGLDDSHPVLVNNHADGPTALQLTHPAQMLSLASYLLAHPLDCRPRTTKFIVTTHYSGSLSAADYTRRHRGDVLAQAVAVLNGEAMGGDRFILQDGVLVAQGEPAASWSYLSAGGSDEIVDIWRAAASAEGLGGHLLLDDAGVYTEAAVFHAEGVPVLSHMSTPAFNLSGSADAIARMDLSRLESIFRAHARALAGLHHLPADAVSIGAR
ncbi:MAG: hypothetical protein AAFV53_05875 [Myxococcota bacterium]